jgi:hypothetical protein
MDTAQEGVRVANLELRTQHVGWYLALAACAFTSVSGQGWHSSPRCFTVHKTRFHITHTKHGSIDDSQYECSM